MQEVDKLKRKIYAFLSTHLEENNFYYSSLSFITFIPKGVH